MVVDMGIENLKYNSSIRTENKLNNQTKDRTNRSKTGGDQAE
jgi:hypothetical protein